MLHPSFQPNDLPWTPFQRVQLPCHFVDTALACLSSSSAIRNSSWTRLRRPLALASFHLVLVMTPKPSLPWLTAPTMSLWHSLASASGAALLADHFRPVWNVMSAWQIFWSLLSHSIITRWALATLNSTITDVLGNCSLLPELYRLMEEKLLGTDNHLRKKVSSFSTPRLSLWELHTQATAKEVLGVLHVDNPRLWIFQAAHFYPRPATMSQLIQASLSHSVI